jgi:hypothetical protein
MSNRKQETDRAVQEDLKPVANNTPLYVEKTYVRVSVKNTIALALERAMSEMFVEKFKLDKDLIDPKSEANTEREEVKYLVPVSRRRVKMSA